MRDAAFMPNGVTVMTGRSRRPRITNDDARRLFLDRQDLGGPPTGSIDSDGILDLVTRMGFVQVDSILTVERAHHMILFARCHGYRPEHLRRLLETDRRLFEHWTHDAAIIPTEFHPGWRLRFQRDGRALRDRWERWGRTGMDEARSLLDHIRRTGPVMSNQFAGTGAVGKTNGQDSGAGFWNWHPSKSALEYLWRTGEVAICHRRGFQKVYDLAENVIPVSIAKARWTDEEIVDWACGAALHRLGFATPSEIAGFWALVKPEEVKGWCREGIGNGTLVEVDVDGAPGQGHRRMLMSAPPPGTDGHRGSKLYGGVRVLSPFDPLIRNRRRTRWLFGFDYRIEVFVPAVKRRFGYYVFPLLEGDRLIGRLDMKRDSRRGALNVTGLWCESGVRLGKGRKARLETAVRRVARFAGCDSVVWMPGWLRGNADDKARA